MKNRHRVKRFFKGLLVFNLILIICFCGELVRSNYLISVNKYTVSDAAIKNPIRIVFFSDLHGREFGIGNYRLLDKIAAQKPDLICMVGDLFNEDADEAEIDRVCAMIESATAIAPVYFSLGNHEFAYAQENGDYLVQRVSSTGAVVLDNEFLDLTIQGTEVRLGGYMGYYKNPHMMVSDKDQQHLESVFVWEFEHTDRYKILLNHIVTQWVDWGAIDRNPVDLVLSGHYHGGVVRIPFCNQGLFTPYIGWFPPFTKGLFKGKTATCILTTGMAGSYGIPRFFNPAEICVVDLLPNNK